MTTRIVIIPGNGCGDIEAANWYGWARDKLSSLPGVDVVMKNMPDPDMAREKYWIPFMHDELNCDENTIIIGHSSGAEAAMRYAEKYKLKAIILVSACVTDLGMESEKESGYYDHPWLWDEMKENVQTRIQYGSTDDPFIPFDTEQQIVADNLNTDFKKYTNKGHFMSMAFPELIKTVKEFLSL